MSSENTQSNIKYSLIKALKGSALEIESFLMILSVQKTQHLVGRELRLAPRYMGSYFQKKGNMSLIMVDDDLNCSELVKDINLNNAYLIIEFIDTELPNLKWVKNKLSEEEIKIITDNLSAINFGLVEENQIKDIIKDPTKDWWTDIYINKILDGTI